MTITYRPEGSGASDSDCTPGGQENKPAPETRTDTATMSLTTGRLETDTLEASWTTPSGAPNDADWPTGDYVVSLNATSIDAEISYKMQQLRVGSGCTVQETMGTSGSQSGTGQKVYTLSSYNPTSGAATDRFQLRYLATNSASMNKNATLLFDGGVAMQGPWVATSAISGTAAGTSTPTAAL